MTDTYHTLEKGDLLQDWSNTALLSQAGDWSRVSSIVGFKGATLTSASNVDARTVTATANDTYIAVNQTNPNTYQTAGVAEFELANPTVAIAGSSNARAPYLALYLDATGRENVTLSFLARDLESGADNSVQQVAVQYRIGNTGPWLNAPGGYLSDASAANATRDTAVKVRLPDAVNGQAQVQVRIITTDFVGFDEWIGIDDIRVTSQRDPGYRPAPIGIFDIQGEGHRSALTGDLVLTKGIVTAIDSNGFFVQDALGDGNAATSDAVFVRTVGAPRVALGDAADVFGKVAETVIGAGLTRTEISAEIVTVTSSGNALPSAVLIGTGGVLPPNQIIEDDGLSAFDPLHDGIDFWESLEGMRVTLDAPQVVSNTNSLGETDVVVSGGADATGITARGGIAIGDGDRNPEMIQIDDRFWSREGFMPDFSVGDRLASVTGVVNYSYDHFEVLATSAATVTRDVTLAKEVTELAGDANHFTVATFNVGNLAPDAGRFSLLGHDIVANLRTPDVIALQKIQDADGTGNGSDLSGAATAQKLIDAIRTESGVVYTYVEIAPDSANSTAGQADGNIRNGYLYRADRVSLVEGSLALITGNAFDNSRKPLVATWEFNGQQVTTVNVHFTSRVGSDALWGAEQQPYAAGTMMRANQAAAVGTYVSALLAGDPALKIMLAGDFNGYWFEGAQTRLTGSGMLTNLAMQLDAAERYSSIYDGNLQLTDNMLVSRGLLANTRFDVVHINSDVAASARSAEHDALVSRIFLGSAPVNLRLSNVTVAENSAAGTVVGVLSASDTLGDTLRYALLDDADGRFAVDAATGVVTATRSFDFETGSSFTIVTQVTDSAGLTATMTAPISVQDVNEAPVALADRIAIGEDELSGNLWAQLLANDSDPDRGDRLSIASVDSTGTLGTLIFDPATGALRYSADHDVFDGLANGQQMIDHFVYTVTDGQGLSHSAQVNVVVSGKADTITLIGGNGKDVLTGSSGEDFLYGGNGQDTLNGGAGHDWLQGDRGNDMLTGGAGRDTFVYFQGDANDIVTDFDARFDRILLEAGQGVRGTKVGDFDKNGTIDLQLNFTNGGSMTLNGIDSLAGVQIDYTTSLALEGFAKGAMAEPLLHLHLAL